MTRLVVFENTIGHALTTEVNAWLAEHPSVMPEEVQYQAVAVSVIECSPALLAYHIAAIAYEDLEDK